MPPPPTPKVEFSGAAACEWWNDAARFLAADVITFDPGEALGVSKDMKSGVAKPLVGNPYMSTELYNLQSPTRDGDKDGIMCER